MRTISLYGGPKDGESVSVEFDQEVVRFLETPDDISDLINGVITETVDRIHVYRDSGINDVFRYIGHSERVYKLAPESPEDPLCQMCALRKPDVKKRVDPYVQQVHGEACERMLCDECEDMRREEI